MTIEELDKLASDVAVPTLDYHVELENAYPVLRSKIEWGEK